MLRRKRAWHEPERGGWPKAIRGLLVAAVGIGVPLGIWIWISSALTPRPEEQPPPPTLGRAEVTAPAGELEGAWTLDPASSWVGYRIEELIPRLDEHFEVVGRTDLVAGRLVLDDTTVEEGWVEADLRGLESDIERRDRAIQRRFLESLEHPDARFALTEPVSLLGAPEPGEPATLAVTGELTLRETTIAVRPLLRVRWDGDRIRVVGTLPVELADYGIRNPVLPGFRIVEEQGVIEVDLTFVPERP
jgi:polyisoprenoid-binding protein YceI